MIRPMVKTMKISELLNIRPGMTALIGGGGKTTLMETLSRELFDKGRVIVCTSTKIMEPDNIPVITDTRRERIVDALKSSRVICVGTRIGNRKLSAPEIGFDVLKELADYVIVEADGAHRLPVKAHADHEPVIPDTTDQTVLVIGADCFGKPIHEICHRPELFAKRAEADIDSAVTPLAVEHVIISERLGDCLYINKVEDGEALTNAQRLAGALDMPVIAGSLKKEEYLCLH